MSVDVDRSRALEWLKRGEFGRRALYVGRGLEAMGWLGTAVGTVVAFWAGGIAGIGVILFGLAGSMVTGRYAVYQLKNCILEDSALFYRGWLGEAFEIRVAGTDGTDLEQTETFLSYLRHVVRHVDRGTITGRAPEGLDFEQKKQFYARSWEPLSVRLADRYVSYRHTPILGCLLAWIVHRVRDRYEWTGEDFRKTKHGWKQSFFDIVIQLDERGLLKIPSPVNNDVVARTLRQLLEDIERNARAYRFKYVLRKGLGYSPDDEHVRQTADPFHVPGDELLDRLEEQWSDLEFDRRPGLSNDAGFD